MFKFQLICKEKNIFGEEVIRYINEDSNEADNLAIGLDGKVYEFNAGSGGYGYDTSWLDKEDVSDRYEVVRVYKSVLDVEL